MGILLRPIRKSLITLNQDIPAFPLVVYRTQDAVVVIVKRQKLLQQTIAVVGSHVQTTHRSN